MRTSFETPLTVILYLPKKARVENLPSLSIVPVSLVQHSLTANSDIL
jgi:hypothetical protein